MKKIKYIILFIMGVSLLNACETDEREVDMIGDGSNLAVFELSSQSVTKIADATVYVIDVYVKLTGPALENVSGDVTVELEVDPSSTAEDGVHYRLDDKTVVLKEADGYLGVAHFTMLTDVVAPLPETPVLVLKVKSASGDIVASGKPIEINLVYGCLSHLDIEYTTEVAVTWASGGDNSNTFVETLKKVDTETYENSILWWDWSVPGYQFINKCGVLSISQPYNGYYLKGFGTYDEVTGILETDFGLYLSQSDADWVVHFNMKHTPTVK